MPLPLPALDSWTLFNLGCGRNSHMLLLLLLLSHFSRIRLCATPQTTAHQAPLSLGFSRQEHWSGLPFPSPVHESEVAQSCPTLSDPMDCSLPGSSVHGSFQARVLEWVAIAFSETATYWILNQSMYRPRLNGAQALRIVPPSGTTSEWSGKW